MTPRTSANASQRSRRKFATVLVTTTATAGLLFSGAGIATATDTSAAPAIDRSVLEPIDPQNWTTSEEMTWADYKEVPGTDWASKTVGSKRVFNGAIVLLDFENQDFVVSQEEGSHVFGNPSGLANNIKRDDVPEFYRNLLNTPNELNNGRTINEYYMEQTGGRLSVDMEAFGPYRMPGNIEEYGLNDSFNKVGGTNDDLCPQDMTCNKVIRTDALKLWGDDLGVADPLAQFDQVFWVTAGHDESGTWEEFGPQLFKSPEEVTDDFGPPRNAEGKALNVKGEEMGNSAKTRYVPWTSWAAASNHWPNANYPVKDAAGNVLRAGNSTQAESSGMGVFAHEFAHILEISDNYGNPYGTDANDGGPLRDTSGPFDVLARGTFNGPGGTHTRWNVPALAGAAQPSGLALRNRLKLDMIDASSVVNLNHTELDAAGSIVVDLQSRAHQEDGVPLGINLKLDGGDKSTGLCTRKAQFDCDGGSYDNYTVEVVDQMGTDSFQPDSGVMIAKTKNKDSNPFIWTIDANPQDIDLVDYTRADGTVVPVTRGDQRQLNDALFHAGTNSGSKFEHVDEANGLHFYVADTSRDDRGILHYGVAVRSLNSANTAARGVEAAAATTVGTQVDDLVAVTVPVTNTAAPVADARANSDIFRVSAAVEGGVGGWSTQLPSEIVTIENGKTKDVTVYVSKQLAKAAAADEGADLVVTTTVTSENDAAATVTATAAVAPKPAETGSAGSSNAGGSADAAGSSDATGSSNASGSSDSKGSANAAGAADSKGAANGSADGKPTTSPKGDGLATTGQSAPWLLGATGAIVLVGGVYLLARARRRATEV